MNEIVFIGSVFDSLRKALLTSNLESCALLLATPVIRQRSTRLLVREVFHVPVSDYRKRNTSRAIIEPSFVALITKKAIQSEQSLVFVHTHPSDETVPQFSILDSEGEDLISKFLKARGQALPNVALVLGQHHCRARIIGTDVPVRVVVLDECRRIEFEPTSSATADERVNRQVKLLGTFGQTRLENLRVAIIGVGGTGSIVAQQLSYLGVKDLLLIDPDKIELSNLNRLVGATPSDVGGTKVRTASKAVLAINPGATVEAVHENILEASIAKLVTETDFFFCCTDSQASRALLNQLAYQYLIPGMNIGVGIASRNNVITHINGRIQLMAPHNACLTCQEVLDPRTVRLEFMTDSERRKDPYFLGDGEPQPAVISLNSTMSSLAVTMFLATVANFPSKPRNLVYSAMDGRVRPASAAITPTCIVCSPRGALARGDSWQLPVRPISA